MATVAYLRVSTDEQAQSGLGLEAQLDAIRRAAGEPAAVYRDEGFSGGDPKRPALLDALESLKTGDVLVVAKRDRLARDSFLAAWIEKEAKRRRARIVSAAGEGTDSDNPGDVLMRRMVDAFAEYERAMIGARTAAALKAKRRRGEKTGGDVPFGHQLAADGRTLVEDPDEQTVIGLVRELRAEGLSLRQIGAELERRGFLTKSGKAKWNPNRVWVLLKTAA
ncbi:MAG: recombinase family protein [Candidatus Latescibacterota bacterium]|jgi:DNA invertase Pin-like site-specific DNA recombinase